MKFKRGDQFQTTVKFEDDNTVAIDITWSTVFFIIRSTDKPKSANDNDDTVKFQKTITSHINPTWGETQISFTSSDTDIDPWSYFRELQIKFSNGNILSASTGVLRVEHDLNKRIT